MNRTGGRHDILVFLSSFIKLFVLVLGSVWGLEQTHGPLKSFTMWSPLAATALK